VRYVDFALPLVAALLIDWTRAVPAFVTPDDIFRLYVTRYLRCVYCRVCRYPLICHLTGSLRGLIYYPFTRYVRLRSSRYRSR